MRKGKGIVVLFFFLLISIRYLYISQQNMNSETKGEFTDISVKEITKIMNNDKSAVTYVLYGQEVCGACRDIKAKLKEMDLAKDILYLDSMESNNRKLLNSYGYDETPTLLVIKDNNISFYTGTKTEEELSDVFEINIEDS